MKTCIILCAGEIDYPALPREFIPRDAFVMAADGGLRHCLPLRLTPDMIIGDFDSLASEELPKEVDIKKLPAEKDETDTYACAQQAVKLEFERVIILGGTGGRMDHTLANMQTLLYIYRHNVDAVMIDEKNIIRLAESGSHKIPRIAGRKLSVLAFSGELTGVTLTGVKYPLDNAVMCSDFPLGVSNEFADEFAVLTIKSGTALIILSMD